MAVGLVHSIQTLGALDGPGLRTVVILQGCPLKCKFCHSIDTTLMDRGTKYESQQLYQQVVRNRPYWKKYLRRSQRAANGNDDPEVQGGVTITGGDPLAQPAFLAEFVKLLKENNVHTVVETSMLTSTHVIDMLMPYVDLWMVSMKYMDEEKHIQLTGKPNRSILQNIVYLDKQLQKAKRANSLRIRYVVVPGLTDDLDNAREMGRFISNLKSLESVELLPYVTLGRYKWIELYGEYDLDGILDATDEDVKPVRESLEGFGIPIFPDNFEEKKK